MKPSTDTLPEFASTMIRDMLRAEAERQYQKDMEYAFSEEGMREAYEARQKLIASKSKNFVVHEKDPEGDGWELSVIREDNIHGFDSYGWPAENKHIVGKGNPPLALRARLRLTAQEYAVDLNSKEAIADTK